MKNQISQNKKLKRMKNKRSKKHQEVKKVDMAGIIQLDGLDQHQEKKLKNKIQRLKPWLR